jgi:hypothetical protein
LFVKGAKLRKRWNFGLTPEGAEGLFNFVESVRSLRSLSFLFVSVAQASLAPLPIKNARRWRDAFCHLTLPWHPERAKAPLVNSDQQHASKNFSYFHYF